MCTTGALTSYFSMLRSLRPDLKRWAHCDQQWTITPGSGAASQRQWSHSSTLILPSRVGPCRSGAARSQISHTYWLVLLGLTEGAAPEKRGCSRGQADHAVSHEELYLGQSESEQVLVYCVAMLMLSTTSFALLFFTSHLPMFVVAELLSQT